MSDDVDRTQPPPGTGLGDAGHTALDILGLVPVFGEAADVANAAWYAAEGRHLEAGLSLISVIPVIGDVVGKGGKLASKFGGALGAKALDVITTLDIPALLKPFANHPKLGPHVERIAEALEGWRRSLLDRFGSVTPPGGPGKCPSLAVREADAAAILEKAAAAEKTTTPRLTDLASRNGMTMEGLDFRLKSHDSLTRKLAETNPADIADALRYTMVSGPSSLGRNAADTLKTLETQGYEVLKVKNSFTPGAPYKGINTQIRSPEGQVFELQFHTPQSFDIKQTVNHELYEKARVLAPGDPQRAILNDAMVRHSETIIDPPDLGKHLGKYLK